MNSSKKIYKLTKAKWRKISKYFPTELTTNEFSNSRDVYRIVSGIVWVASSNLPWREMPAEYGDWETAYDFFVKSKKYNLWPKVFSDIDKTIDYQKLYFTMPHGSETLLCHFFI
ncbi:transposase [Pectinatus sottacetonis]|uniref:transposase n=1 Tax=Pectinatus sottacetonis TaxID=1002795 RepID=UPI0018C75447